VDAPTEVCALFFWLVDLLRYNHWESHDQSDEVDHHGGVALFLWLVVFGVWSSSFFDVEPFGQ